MQITTQDIEDDDLFDEVASKAFAEKQNKELNFVLKQLSNYLQKDENVDTQILASISCNTKELSVLLQEIKKVTLILDRPMPTPQVTVNTDIKSLSMSIDKLLEKQQAIIENQKKIIEISSFKPIEMEAIRDTNYGFQQIEKINIKYSKII